MTIQQRAAQLKEKARLRAVSEMDAIGRTNWKQMVAQREKAVRVADHAWKQVNNLIESALIQKGVNSQSREAWDAFSNAQLDLADLILNRNSKAEMRIAQMQGYSDSIASQKSELQSISKNSTTDAAKKLKNFTGKAKAASSFLKDVAADPLKYYDVAEKFITGKVATKLPNLITSRLPSVPSTNQFIDFLKNQGASVDDFLKAKVFFEKATRFLGVAQIGFAVVTVVFETLSNQGQWASQLASASVAAGSGIALGAIVTGTAMTSVLTSTLAAAGITAEVPPLAGVIVAAGIVILASMAIVSLFDGLITSMFGKLGIPRSMRLSMTSGMFTEMSTSMSADMATSMVSLPQ